MPKFSDAETLYGVMHDMFAQVTEKNPKAFDEMIKARLTVRFKVNAPSAEITVDGKSRPPKMTYGAYSGRPDIDLDLTGDNLDKLLSHQISATKAVTDGTIKFKGNILKLKSLLPMIKAGNAEYSEVLKTHKLG